MNKGMHHIHLVTLLQQARERVASGWPSVALALAGSPVSSAHARLEEAEAVRYASEPAPAWVLVLTEAIAAAEEARALWGSTPDTMPLASLELAPCASELRLCLAGARACAEKHFAWEDPDGLTRPQALCVLHLAVCLAQWRALEARTESAAERAQAELERERTAGAVVAARRIWGGQPTTKPERVKEPRSLRDLAQVANAFDKWSDDDEP